MGSKQDDSQVGKSRGNSRGSRKAHQNRRSSEIKQELGPPMSQSSKKDGSRTTNNSMPLDGTG